MSENEEHLSKTQAALAKVPEVDEDGNPIPRDERESRAWWASVGNRVGTPANKKQHPDELPTWVKRALVYNIVNACTNKEAAEAFGKAQSTFENYKRSPAAKAYVEGLADFMDDPVEVAKAMLKGNALAISLDRLMMLEQAKEVGDYKTADKIAADLQSRIGLAPQRNKADGPTTVVLKLPGGTSVGELEMPSVEAEWEMVQDEADD